MTFDPESREESAARAIRRSRGALDAARRSNARPPSIVERVLHERLRPMRAAREVGPTSSPQLAERVSGAGNASHGSRDIVPWATSTRENRPAVARPIDSPTAPLGVTRTNPPDWLAADSPRGSVGRRATETTLRAPIERPANHAEIAPADFPADSTVEMASPQLDLSSLLVQLRPELESVQEELRREMQVLADVLRAEAMRHDSARLVAMQM